MSRRKPKPRTKPKPRRKPRAVPAPQPSTFSPPFYGGSMSGLLGSNSPSIATLNSVMGGSSSRVPVNLIHGFLPENIYLLDDGTIEEVLPHTGVVEKVDAMVNSRGKPYLEFSHDRFGLFTLWLSSSFFEAFNGPVPRGTEVCHRDGQPLNLLPSNLILRSKPPVPAGYRLHRPPV
jgi:hypothetical protein